MERGKVATSAASTTSTTVVRGGIVIGCISSETEHTTYFGRPILSTQLRGKKS
jgi:hypothetical protein